MHSFRQRWMSFSLAHMDTILTLCFILFFLLGSAFGVKASDELLSRGEAVTLSLTAGSPFCSVLSAFLRDVFPLLLAMLFSGCCLGTIALPVLFFFRGGICCFSITAMLSTAAPIRNVLLLLPCEFCLFASLYLIAAEAFYSAKTLRCFSRGITGVAYTPIPGRKLFASLSICFINVMYQQLLLSFIPKN